MDLPNYPPNTIPPTLVSRLTQDTLYINHPCVSFKIAATTELPQEAPCHFTHTPTDIATHAHVIIWPNIIIISDDTPFWLFCDIYLPPGLTQLICYILAFAHYTNINMNFVKTMPPFIQFYTLILKHIADHNDTPTKDKTLGIFLYLSKAFDTNCHSTLLRKLEHYDIREICNN